MKDKETARARQQAQHGRCRCMTTVYGGVKRCRAQAGDDRGWCARHSHYNGANHTPAWGCSHAS